MSESQIEVIEKEAPKEAPMEEADVEASTEPVFFCPVCPDDAPAVLTFSDLTVTKKGTDLKLLNNVSGSICGGLWAIMGPSGGGKTTLLSTLALRINRNVMEIEGHIRLNGREYDSSILKSVSAYVMQDDLMHAELTCSETLYWASLLRMPRETSAKDRAARVEEVINLMDIAHCRDTIVGNTRRKGISGGQRKRLAIAVDLLNRPKLIFLDEPTSGLDSSTAYVVIKALKNLTSLGSCTAVCTIHQPAPKTFALFDNLVLMKRGECVFLGSLKDTGSFLETLGKPCPPGINLADHLIESISTEGVDKETVKEFKVPIDLQSGAHKDNFANMQGTKNLLFQIQVLFRRNIQQSIRNWQTFVMGMGATIVMALLVGSGVWRNIGNDQEAVTLLPPALFFTCVNQGVFAALQSVNSFPGERAIMLRERQAGAYNTFSYFMAKTLTDMVVQIWQPIVFSCILYPLYNLRPGANFFFIYMGFMVLDTLAATACATMVTCFCVTVELSTVFLSLLFEVSRLYGGFFTSPAQLAAPEFNKWKWLDAISYIKYAFVGVALNELQGLEFTCPPDEVCEITTGEQVIAQRGYDQYTISGCAGGLLLYILLCRMMGFIGLKVLKN